MVLKRGFTERQSRLVEANLAWRVCLCKWEAYSWCIMIHLWHDVQECLPSIRRDDCSASSDDDYPLRDGSVNQHTTPFSTEPLRGHAKKYFFTLCTNKLLICLNKLQFVWTNYQFVWTNLQFVCKYSEKVIFRMSYAQYALLGFICL